MSRSGTVRIDISGWTYGGWRGSFYPPGLRHSEELYTSGYSDEALDHWAARIKLWARGLEPNDARLIAPDMKPPRRSARDVYVYFDNDAKVRAPVDAHSLRAKLADLA